MRFLISAGEASGELYGAGLIEALRKSVPDAQSFGVGGQRMRDAGFETVVDAHKISVVGLAEVITHLPMIRREFKRLVDEAARRKPDAAILIDFPDFNLRLARELHKLGIPVIYYVSPQLWAWRQGRIKQVQKYVRKMLVIFPFEVDFYRQHGVQAEYVGHPLLDEPLPTLSRMQYAGENKLDPAKTWIALLPGSRKKEFALNIGAMLETARRLQAPDIEFVLPVATSLDMKWAIAQATSPNNSSLCDISIHFVHDASPALLHSRAAIVASGTATLQTALIGTPFVMIYRVSPLTYAIGRRFVKLSRFAMVNLVAGRDVVPEFVQQDFIPEKVAEAVRGLMVEGNARDIMKRSLAEVREKLHSPGEKTAAERAASAILATLAR